jgi:cystathionine beta-lyase/cystathionine gamma-synthase
MSLKKLNEKKYSIPTRLIYGKSVAREWDYSHHVIPPITISSTFRLGSTERGAHGFGEIGQLAAGNQPPIYVYDRMGEPTVDMLQHALATAEEKDIAVVYATGMAAVHAATCFALNPQSEIISHHTVYGCTYSLFTNWLPKLGVKVHFCDLTNPQAFLPLVNENTRVLYLESPVNPTLDLLDTEAIVKALKPINSKRPDHRSVLTVMDNTFATPYCQRPGKQGVDVIVHSLTKGLSGFGTVMGGAVVTDRQHLEPLILFRKDFGSMLSPLAAWHILVYGVSTLSLRVPRQQASALKIAKFLAEHPMVEKVRYPGLSSFPQYEIAQRLMRDYEGNFAPGIIIYFALKGDTPDQSKERGEKMMNYIAQNAYSITLAVSLGQLRTLIEHPGSMTHASYPALEQVALGIDPGGVRLAVGIENPDDIIADLQTALSHIQ